MKNTKTFKALMIMLTLVLALALTACGGNAPEEAGGEEDGQNPIMNFVGNYSCGRCSILVEATDSVDGAKLSISWGSSASTHSEWEMTGKFDEETLSIKYDDCVRTDIEFEENGDIKSQDVIYEGGHGVIQFSDDGGLSLTWQDDEENMAEDMIFTYVN